MTSEQHQQWMQHALRLAAQARGRTTPNPMVGSVIVTPEGELLAEGYHRRAGEAHAEVDALRKVDGKAPGSTLYVNLEPCCHYGRTPPCTEALIASSVSHVVVGIQDPNPKVDGKGIQQLRDAGIQVTVGVLEDECRALNMPYFTHIQHHRPMVSLKAAMSLDGKIATHTGDARWLSHKEARTWAHRIRDHVDAILVGANTVTLDNPALNVRHVEGKDPVRIVLDSKLTTPLASQLYQAPLAEGTWVLTTEAADASKAQTLSEQGVRVVTLPADKDGHVSIEATLHYINEQKLIHLLVEGGGHIHGSFLRARLVDRVHFVMTPWVVGNNGRSAFQFDGPDLLAHAMQIHDVQSTPLGPDILIEGTPHWDDPVS